VAFIRFTSATSSLPECGFKVSIVGFGGDLAMRMPSFGNDEVLKNASQSAVVGKIKGCF